MTSPQPVRRRSWLTKRRAGWLSITLLIWLSAVGLTLLEAKTLAEQGRDRLFAVAGVVDSDDVVDVDLDSLQSEVSAAHADLDQADRLLRSPLVRPLRPVPIVGRQLSSAQAIARSAAATSGQIDLLLGSVITTRDAATSTERVAGLETIARKAAALEDTLVTNDLGPSDRLVASLAGARATFDQKQSDLLEVVAPLADISAGLSLVLGDSRYLLLGANPSEMRLAGGMPLSAGQLEVRGGEFDLLDVTPTHALYPVDGGPVLDPDIADRWGFLSPTDDYRKLGYSARFAEWTGPQAIAMWERQFGVDLDGVIQVDPFLMEALLSVIGPVEVEGRMFDDTNITEYLLIGQYEEFGDIDYSVQDDRRDQLALVALAVLREVGTRQWDPTALVDALAEAGRGRHILAYSDDPAQQLAWEELGVAGRLEGDEAGVFLLNITAAKLDSFMDLEVDVVSTVEADNRRHVTMSIEVTNRVPTDVSAQAAGLWEVVGLEDDGSYLGRLVVYAPAYAENVRFDDGRALEVFGPDGQVWVMGSRLELNRGRTQVIPVSFDIPAEIDYLDVVPSTRYPFQSWQAAATEYTDVEAFRLMLNR